MLQDQQAPTSLNFNLGSTFTERKNTAKQIKDAMAAAILWQVENGTVSKDDENFQVYEQLYLEAKHIEMVLDKM